MEPCVFVKFMRAHYLNWKVLIWSLFPLYTLFNVLDPHPPQYLDLASAFGQLRSMDVDFRPQDLYHF